MWNPIDYVIVTTEIRDTARSSEAYLTHVYRHDILQTRVRHVMWHWQWHWQLTSRIVTFIWLPILTRLGQIWDFLKAEPKAQKTYLKKSQTCPIIAQLDQLEVKIWHPWWLQLMVHVTGKGHTIYWMKCLLNRFSDLPIFTLFLTQRHSFWCHINPPPPTSSKREILFEQAPISTKLPSRKLTNNLPLWPRH